MIEGKPKYMQLKHLHHKQNRWNSLTDIFQLTQGAAWVSVSLSVWTPDCYAHTCLSGRWQNKLPSSEMRACLGVCVCMYVCMCMCDLDILLIRSRRNTWPDSCRAKEQYWQSLPLCMCLQCCACCASECENLCLCVCVVGCVCVYVCSSHLLYKLELNCLPP